LVQDDLHFIADSPAIMDPARVLAGWPSDRRLVANLTFAVQYQLHGLSLPAFHAVNIVIHLLASGVLYALAALTLIRAGSPNRSACRAALLAAALFAIHPLQTQAVTYLVQRMTSLAALFYLVSLYSYAASRWSESPLRRWVWLAGAFLAAILAMRTKEIAITLPVAAALYDVSFLPGPLRRRVLPLGVMASSVVVLLAGFPATGGVAKIEKATRVQTAMSRTDYLMTEIPVVASYVRLWLVPTGQNVDHDVPLKHALDAEVVLSAVLLLASAAGGAAALRRKRSPEVRLAGFGVLFFFLALSLESSVIPIVDVMVEHRVYLPGAGLATAAGSTILWWSESLSQRGKSLLAVAAVAWVVVLAAATRARNELWRDPVALWTDAATKSPRKPRVRTQLATLLLERGDREGARRELTASLSVDPHNAKTVGQMGNLYWSDGRREAACRQWERCVELDPGLPPCRYNLGGCLEMIGDQDGARREYKRFLDLAQPDDYREVAVLRERFANGF
jgi:hypothetical protein